MNSATIDASVFIASLRSSEPAYTESFLSFPNFIWERTAQEALLQ